MEERGVYLPVQRIRNKLEQWAEDFRIIARWEAKMMMGLKGRDVKKYVEEKTTFYRTILMRDFLEDYGLD